MDKLTLRKLQGKAARPLFPGFGTCYRCERPWPICKHHDTQYTEGSGCFPLCEDCWSELTPQERLPYYYQLWRSWVSLSDKKEDIVDWQLIKTAILAGK